MFDTQKSSKACSFKNAKWIGAASSGENFCYIFRKEFEVKEFEKASLLLAVMGYARVFINGEAAISHSMRSFSFDKLFEAYDIGKYLRKGKNVIAVLATGEPTQIEHEFLAEIQFSGGNTCSVSTDSSWRWQLFLPYSEGVNFFVNQLGYEEVFDSNLFDKEIFLPCYDDLAWGNASERVFSDIHLTKNEQKLEMCKSVWPEKYCSACTYKNPTGYNMALRIKGYETKNATAFVTELSLKNDATIIIKLTTEASKISVDGKPVLQNEKINLSKGRHKLCYYALTFRVQDSEIFIETQDEICFSSHFFEGSRAAILEVVGAKWEYPWNMMVDCVEVPKIILDLMDAPEMESIPEYVIKELVPANEKDNTYTHSMRLASYSTPIENADELPFANGIINLVGNTKKAVEIFPAADADGVRIIVDFGVEKVGIIDFDIEAPKNAKIKLHGFEKYQNGEMTFLEKTNTVVYISQQGRQHYTSYSRRGMRYLAIYLSDFKEKVTIYDLHLEDLCYLDEVKSPFESNDSVLNRASQIAMESARICMLDSYIDCPGYEQAVWTADAHMISQANCLALGEYDFDRQYLRLVGNSLEKPYMDIFRKDSSFDSTGKYFTFAAYPDFPRGGTPIWSFHWVLNVYEHYLYTGDKSCLKFEFERVCTLLENCINLTNERGLLEVQGAWNFLDWAANDISMCGEAVSNTAMLIMSLKAAAKMAEELEDDKIKVRFLKKAEEYTCAVNNLCYDEERRAYVDTVRDDYSYEKYCDFCNKKNIPILCDNNTYKKLQKVSVHTNMLLYLAGAIPKEREEGALRFLLQDFEQGVYQKSSPAMHFNSVLKNGPDNESHAHIGSTLFLAFAYETLSLCDRHDLVLKSIRDVYGDWIDNGYTTCPEAIPMGRSVAHGCGALAVTGLITYILGVKPIQPGFKSFVVEPRLCDLQYAKGTVQTPYGVITVFCRKDGDRLLVDVNAPKECTYKIIT